MPDFENYYSLHTLFSNDEYKFDDEKLASNLYLTSFSTSQNEIAKICETNPTLLGIVQKDMRVEEIVQQQKSIFDIFSDMQISDDILQIGDRLLCQKK